jgi:NTP pyrophosphatase (non-canonical NTP hydrolase)
MTGTAASSRAGFPETAAGLLEQLRAHRRPGVTEAAAFDASLVKVIEETGELAGAHSRLAGTSRRQGSAAEVAAELADVYLSAAVCAVHAGVPDALTARHLLTAGRPCPLTGAGADMETIRYPPGVTATGAEDAVLAAGYVRRCLGLDAVPVPVPAPHPGTGRRAVPGACRRQARPTGRRR